MSTRVSSATNLSATYFMRNFYSNNRDAINHPNAKNIVLQSSLTMIQPPCTAQLKN